MKTLILSLFVTILLSSKLFAYEYVGNNPMNATDPLGLQMLSVEVMFLGEVPPIIRPALPAELLNEAVRLNAPRNRVSLPDGRKVDLAGKPHFDKPTGQEIECPHTHQPGQPNPPPFDKFPPNIESVRPSTIQDIQDAISHLMNSFNSLWPFGGTNPDV